MSSPRSNRTSRWALAVALAVSSAAHGTAYAADEPAPAVDAAAEVDDVVVTGRQDRTVVSAGALGTRSILETPFSIGSADQKAIERIAATTIDAAFNYDPSIRSNSSGIAAGNTFNVRGQSVDLTNGYKYDGLAFPYWFQDQPIETLSEIQVLKGAGGFVYGYASPSGVVNFISKKPTDTLRAEANISFRSSSIVRAHVDIGGPFTEGGSTAFRFNAVQEQGTLYNGAENKNQFATLWLQGEITPDLTWSVDGYYQRTWQTRQSNSVLFTTAVTSLPAVGGEFNLGTASSTKFNDVSQITGKLNYEISPDWKASVSVRHSVLDERFRGNVAQITSNSGDYVLGLLNQNRLFFYNVGQASVNGSFETGALKHNVVAGFDYLDVNFDYDYQPYISNGRPGISYGFGLAGNIYTTAVPDWGSNPAALAFQRPPNYFRYQEIRQRGLFASDTVKLGFAELMLGVRWTSYKETNDEPVTADTRFRENSFTPVASLSFDVAPGARIYGSYVEALQRGGTAPTNALNFGESFGPLKSKQYEVGAKVQRGKWGGTLALFRASVPSEFVTAPATGATLGTFVREGERRFQGIELDTNFSPSSEWYLKFGLAYLDAIQTKSATASLVGAKVPGTTAFQTSGFVEYKPGWLAGASVFGGVRHNGKAYGNPTNTFVFAAVTQGDVGASYTFPVGDNTVKLQANIQNITDEKYWVPGAGGASLSAGAPRTFSLSLGVATGALGGGLGVRRNAAGTRDGGWYLGAEAGVLKPQTARYDLVSRINPAIATVRDGLAVKRSTGWEVAGTIGYDFGPFRTEVEASHKEARLDRLTLASVQVPLQAGRTAGTYADPGGLTRVLAVMANGLVDFGGSADSPWGFEAGGGVGLARVNEDRWQFVKGPGTPFQADNKTGFAWQAIAGVRRAVSDRVDLTVRYRFFDVPNLKQETVTANEIDGGFRSHSVLAGVTLKL